MKAKERLSIWKMKATDIWDILRADGLYYRDRNILLAMLQDFVNQTHKAEWEDFFDIHKNEYFPNGCSVSNSNKINPSPSQQYKEQPKKVVLFVKADRGKSVIDHIRSTNSLDESIQDQLSEFTSYLWLGNGFDDSIFEKPENVSEIVPEYDVVAIKTAYLQGYQLKDKSDGYELRQLIKTLCKKNIQCEKISNRLSFDDINGLKKYQVN